MVAVYVHHAVSGEGSHEALRQKLRRRNHRAQGRGERQQRREHHRFTFKLAAVSMHNYPSDPHATSIKFGHKPTFELGQDEAESG